MMTTLNKQTLSHLDWLEAEAIHIMREVAGQCERPVLLFSGGKDSVCMLRVAEKAFRPGKFPFPLMHIDTTWKFQEMYRMRDEYVAKELGFNFGVRTKLGQRFERYLARATKTARDQYKQASRAEKEQRRKEWAEQQFETYQKSRSYIEEDKEIDFDNGNYLNWDQLLAAENGGTSLNLTEEAIHGAKQVALYCMKHKGKWIKTNKQSQRVMFLYVSSGSAASTTKAWASKQTDSDGLTNRTPAAAMAARPAAAVAARPAAAVAAWPAAALAAPAAAAPDLAKDAADSFLPASQMPAPQQADEGAGPSRPNKLKRTLATVL